MPRPRYKRNRKRSRPGGRRITCPAHGCLVQSASQKYRLFAESFERSRQETMLSLRSGAAIEQMWLEAFWCPDCQERTWYQVRKLENAYELKLAPTHIWMQTCGTYDPTRGNPSVSEFSQRQAGRKLPRIFRKQRGFDDDDD